LAGSTGLKPGVNEKRSKAGFALDAVMLDVSLATKIW
jgi:hypothetical protein